MSATIPSPAEPAGGAAASLRVYNTLTKIKEPFQPLRPGQVGIYLCGPTVYKEAHIGHMVGPVIFDTIKRYLVYNGFDTTLVVNITDVDDKLIAQANLRGVTMAQVAEEMTADYLANLRALGVDQIDHMPRATENIGEIIRFIEDLAARGFAYESGGNVFFDVAQDAAYGKLSNRSADAQQGEGGEAAASKRSSSDFTLWKAAKPNEPSWDSPWGKGRPGWHIECSAMSRRLLGETFEIHGGGLDLVFPHHENELAQSECRHGKPMVKYWVHNGLLKAAAQQGKVGGRAERQADADGGEKMSRSKGAGGLADLIARQGGERIRFFLLRTHYRSTIVFSEEGIEEAGTGLETFTRFFDRYQRISGDSFYDLTPVASRNRGDFAPQGDPLLERVRERRLSFLAKMDDDFNTGGAVSDLFELARLLNRFIDEHQLEDPGRRDESRIAAFRQGAATLRELTALLGLFRAPPQPPGSSRDELAGKLLDLMVELRGLLRKKKDFAAADYIRDALSRMGVTLEDRKDGSHWRIDE